MVQRKRIGAVLWWGIPALAFHLRNHAHQVKRHALLRITHETTLLCHTRLLLRAWRAWMVEHTTLTPFTINRRVSAVKRLVKASVICGALDERLGFQFALVERVALAALRERLRHRRALTVAQVRALCRAPDPLTRAGLRDRALLHLLASSGCRISEAVSCTVGDLVPYEAGWVVQVLGKGAHAYALAPVSDEAYEAIQRWLAARKATGVEVPCIFTGFSGRYHAPTPAPLSRYGAWKRIKLYAAQVGLPQLTAHDLRKFVATAIAKKHGLRAAQLALRHQKLETTTTHYLQDTLPGRVSEGLY